MSYRATTAKLIEYLVDYDGPQLALLVTDRNREMLAHAVYRGDMKDAFFGCEVPEKAYNKYFAGTADLNYAFQRATQNAFYFFDNAFVEGADDVVQLQPATKIELENEAYWPRSGIFSRSHTSQYNRNRPASSTKTYKIDGTWGASDFSHFYGKMSDLYSFFAVINRFEGSSAPKEKAFLSHAIRERLWRGGGSYSGFFDDLDTHNTLNALAPLEVAKIQYASPGHIDLRGNTDALSYTADVIALFEENSRELGKSYNEIHNILRKAKMLKARPDTQFPARAIQEHVLNRTREFAQAMKLENIDQIFEASGPNVLVFAKLVLSIYRRANELYTFEAEGRVQRA